jgi:repressor LexA
MPVQGTLPLVGRVAAGNPILASENIEGRYRVDPALFSPRADYLLRVRGQSMRDAGILDGDLLAVHRTAEARNGQIVVARIGAAAGDEVTVKRFRKRGREIVLQPENSAFEPIVVDPRATPFAIEGVGVGLIRSGSCSSNPDVFGPRAARLLGCISLSCRRHSWSLPSPPVITA